MGAGDCPIPAAVLGPPPGVNSEITCAIPFFRVAGVLHCIELGITGTIDAATLTAAIKIARYLVPHAEAVLEKMEATEDSSNSDAEYVLRWIERDELRHFTKRDVHQHGKRRFRYTNRAARSIELSESGWQLRNRKYSRLLSFHDDANLATSRGCERITAYASSNSELMSPITAAAGRSAKNRHADPAKGSTYRPN